MSSQALTCRELVELMTDYLEGALAPAERARFEAHLAGCPHCPAYLDQMRTTIRIIGKLRAETLPPAATRAMLTLFRDWKRPDGQHHPKPKTPRVV